MLLVPSRLIPQPYIVHFFNLYTKYYNVATDNANTCKCFQGSSPRTSTIKYTEVNLKIKQMK